jgi:hypothetical protein
MVDCCVKNGALKYFIVLFDKLLLIPPPPSVFLITIFFIQFSVHSFSFDVLQCEMYVRYVHFKF